MEFNNMNEIEQKGTERLIALIFTIYSVLTVMIFSRKGLPSWIPFFMCVGAAVVWFLQIIQYKNYGVRALITTLVMQICMLIYGINSDNFDSILSTFFVMTALVAMFGVVDYMYVTLVTIFIIIVNAVIFERSRFVGAGNYSSVVGQLFNIAFFEFVMTFWVKKRSESGTHTRQIIEALKKAERSKDDFLANVSHEIRTPLNTISGMSEIILEENEPEKLRDNIYQIQMASRNLMSTVSDILDFSELQSGQMSLEKENYNICSTINDIVNMTLAQRAEKNIDIIVNVDANIPKTLYGDEKKIRRVVMNFMNNAIKFTSSGYVGLNVSYRKESYGINLIIDVTDTGIGISEENIEKIFSSFGQIDTRRNRQEGGVGLGLAISKAIAEKMGGIISVHSVQGQGTRMSLIVPQKVVENEPAVVLKDKENASFICYINLEKFRMAEMRDAYVENISGMITNSGAKGHYCKNLEEMKRRLQREKFNYAFITFMEYEEDREFFDRLSHKLKLVIMLERNQDVQLGSDEIIKLYKPCYLLPIVAMLNNDVPCADKGGKTSKFTTKDVHLLVVDDNLMNIKVVEGLLKKYDIKVTYALSGAEALEKIEAESYDFIFMDHMMPEMDGVETAHRIRAKRGRYYETVPIIALTANAVAGSREMFLKEGFADFIEKPLEVSVLERVLKRNLPEKKIIYLDSSKIENEPEEKIIHIKPETLEKKPAGEEVKKDMGEEGLRIGKLDVEKACMFCGGEESFLMLISMFCEDYRATRKELDELFAARDWKNYTIKIHALKSTMKNFGESECSALAYELEKAGKEGRTEYILENHEACMKCFREKMLEIAAHPSVNADVSMIVEDMAAASGPDVQEEQEDTSTGLLAILEEDELRTLVSEFENAAYSLDKAAMLDILNSLERCMYKGEPLRDELPKLLRKVENEDYFSAVEALGKICDKQ